VNPDADALGKTQNPPLARACGFDSHLLISQAVGWRYDSGYTRAMKTAVSIPDPLFEQADRMARQLGISRSQLYAVAVESFLKDHEQQSVTAALDRIYSEEPSALGPELAQLEAAHLSKNEW
jgi:hypothetical protein